jgi:hypothetical protein
LPPARDDSGSGMAGDLAGVLDALAVRPMHAHAIAA